MYWVGFLFCLFLLFVLFGEWSRALSYFSGHLKRPPRCFALFADCIQPFVCHCGPQIRSSHVCSTHRPFLFIVHSHFQNSLNWYFFKKTNQCKGWSHDLIKLNCLFLYSDFSYLNLLGFVWFFKIRSLYVISLSALELTLYTSLASNSEILLPLPLECWD